MSKMFVKLLCVSFATWILTACNETVVMPDYPPVALAIVVGRTVGSNEYTESMYSEVEVWVKRATIGGYVCLIVADGEPFISHVFGAEAFPKNAMNSDSMNRFIDIRTKKVMDFIKSDAMLPVSDETDLIGALVIAERALYADEAYGLEKRVLIMHSGLPTIGDALNLNNPETAITVNSLENGSIDRIVSELKSIRGNLPDFTDVSIKWVGMGNTCTPQRLPSTIGVQIESLWQAILSETGAVFSENDVRIKATGGTPIVYIEGVTRQVSPILFDAPVQVEPSTDTDGHLSDKNWDLENVTIIDISSEQVEFLPNQAIFWNELDARDVLSGYAKRVITFLKRNKDARIYVVGFSAKVSLDGKNRFQTTLSEQRAAAVTAILIEYDVPENRLVTFGLGENGGSEIRANEFERGVFNNAIAQRNRKVMLISDSTPEADLVWEIWQELEDARNR